MGFHVINIKEDKTIGHEYVESLDKLAYVVGLTENSIIYEGEAHWIPVVAGDSQRYKLFTFDWYKAGMKAQDVFQRQARENGYILEPINQDQKSFKSYTDVVSEAIKRSDFLIRNAGHIEVDVKCRSFHHENGERYIKFKVEDFTKHINMSLQTNSPVIIAVYKRVGDAPSEDHLYMFEIGDLLKEIDKLEKGSDDIIGRYYKIPLGKTRKGFKLIEKYKNKPQA